jgi:hypothetical protein
MMSYLLFASAGPKLTLKPLTVKTTRDENQDIYAGPERLT